MIFELKKTPDEFSGDYEVVEVGTSPDYLFSDDSHRFREIRLDKNHTYPYGEVYASCNVIDALVSSGEYWFIALLNNLINLGAFTKRDVARIKSLPWFSCERWGNDYHLFSFIVSENDHHGFDTSTEHHDELWYFLKIANTYPHVKEIINRYVFEAYNKWCSYIGGGNGYFPYDIKENYGYYLTSPSWRTKRKIMNYLYPFCQICRRSNGERHVHHNTYENTPYEKLSDLVVLCSDCHAKFHGKN